MSEDVIDTFRNTTPAVNQEFAQKSQFETCTIHRISYSKTLYVNHVFLSYTTWLPIFQEICTVNNPKKNNYLPKRGHFTGYTRWQDSDDVKKCKFWTR